jgi:hypothetical protein
MGSYISARIFYKTIVVQRVIGVKLMKIRAFFDHFSGEFSKIGD